MKASFKKKNLTILLIIINVFLTLSVFFGTPFTIFSEYDNGFFSVVANVAQQNEHKNVVFSYSKEKENDKFIDNYFSYRDDKTMSTKHKSLLLSPLQNNGVLINNNFENTYVILHDKIYASKQSDGYFKMSVGNFFYHSQPIGGSSSLTNKSISVSESIAKKLMSFLKLDSYSELGGKIIEFQYKNTDGKIEIAKMYVRGVLMSLKGDMVKYRKLYGEDIVLFYPEYFDFLNTEAHFYFNQSVKSNQDNYKFIGNFGLGEDITIKNANLGVDKNHELQEMFTNRLKTEKNNSGLKTLITVIYFILIFLILFLSLLIIPKYKNGTSLSVLLIAISLFINELISILISLNKYNPSWQVFDNSTHGTVLIIYCALIISIPQLLKKNNKKKTNYEQGV